MDKRFTVLHLLNLLSMLKNTRVSCDPKPLRLADLTSLYASRLKEHAIEHRHHTTRLKNNLLGAITDMQAHVSGKDMLVVLTLQVGKALESSYRNSGDNEPLCLAKAARILNFADILNHKFKYFYESGR